MQRFASAVILSGTVLLNGGQNSTDEAQPPAFEEQKDTFTDNSEEVTTEKNAEILSGTDGEIHDKAPQISITRDYINWFTEDNRTCLFEQTYCTVEVANDGFDNLAEVLHNWSEEYIIPDGDIESELQSAEERLEFAEDPTDFLSYYVYQNVQIGRSDAHILSLIEDYSEDYTTNGGYVNYGRIGYTFDVRSGKRLVLEDLLTDKEDFFAKAADYMAGNIYEDYSEHIHPDYEQRITNILTEYNANYYLDASGIVLIYYPWEIGPYALQEEHMTFPYAIFGKYLKPDYRTAQSAAIANVPANENIAFFAQTKSPVRIEDALGDYQFGTRIISGTHVSDHAKKWFFDEAYVIRRTDGKRFLVIDAGSGYDYDVFVYDITDGGLQLCDELKGTGRIMTQVGLDTVTLYMALDILGSYMGEMCYAIEADGTLTQAAENFSIVHPRLEMTVTKELPVTINDKKTTLPVGSTLKITAADNVDTVYFISGDGKEGYINYTLKENDQVHYIDGISEYRYFDAIPYQNGIADT